MIKIPGFVILNALKNLLFLSAFFLLLPQYVYAGELNELSVRLDRVRSDSPVAGTLCAKPSSNAAEARVSITFPSDFSISTSTSSWTANTQGLPAGSTAWPQIGSIAQSVTGNTVTFLSGDLTSAAVLYCFNFQGVSSETGSAGQRTGTVETRSALGQVIDAKAYAVNIVNDDQIRITASVGQHASDFQINLSSTHAAQEVSQDTFMEFEVTYGSYLPYQTELIIEAVWGPETFEGGGSPGVKIAHYAWGSATNAINGVSPIIDIVNRKIRWTIPNFPANTTGRKVKFTLYTGSEYRGPAKIKFPVAARIIASSVVTPDRVINRTYRYDPNKRSPITAPQAPGDEDPLDEPAEDIPPIVFRNIFIPVISQNDAKIFVQTYGKHFHSIRYGKDPARLTDRITSLNKIDAQTFDVTNLEPDTNYYFKAEVRDAAGRVTGTETFTFKTAQVSAAPEIERSTIIVTSQNSILSVFDQNILKGDFVGQIVSKYIVIPQETVYQIRFALKRGAQARLVQAIVRARDVLGATTAYAQEPNSQVADMVEVEPGVFAGSLKSSLDPGYYEQYARIVDNKGNIREEKIADIRVLNPFTVRSKESNKPIEGARVLILLYNPKTKTYKVIPPNAAPFGNPSFTDHKGEISPVLTQGRYRAQISRLGYHDETIDFTIGPNPEDGFPVVELEAAPFNPFLYIKNLYYTFNDVLLRQFFASVQNIGVLGKSPRAFEFFAASSILILVLLSALTFYFKTHMRFSSLTRFFLFHGAKTLRKNGSARFFTGRIVDEEKNPVSRAAVYLISDKNHKVIDQTESNKLGEFYLKTTDSPAIKLAVMKKGYEPVEAFEYAKTEDGKDKITIELARSHGFKKSVVSSLIHTVENALGLSFEIILLTTILFELMFLTTLGFSRTAPFMVISLVNFLLWLAYLRQAVRHRGLFVGKITAQNY
jgi:hypothetical protein